MLFRRIAILFSILFGFCDGAKILMIMPIYTKSHNTMFYYVSKILATRGHKITLITPYPLAQSHPNIQHYRVGDLTKLEEHEGGEEYFEGYKESPIELFYSYSDFFVDCCEDLYKHEQVQRLIKQITKRKGLKLFDVAMVEMMPTECALPFANLVANHTILVSVVNLLFHVSMELRIPAPTSSVAMPYMTDASHVKTFADRFINTFNSLGVYLVWKYNIVSKMQAVVDKYLPPWKLSVLEALHNINFIILNTDPILATAMPTVPFVLQVGGIHLREPQKLPEDLQKFMDSSGEDGVILLSLGSYVDTKAMSIKIRDEFLQCFGTLKQKVLWKHHEEIEGCPNNIKLLPWLPQKEILAHPKMRLYLNHGGILSSQEALYFGIPIIGIPIFADQQQNIAILHDYGVGEVIPIHEVTSTKLCDAIHRVLTNKRYSEKAKAASAVLKDRENTPAESVIYWTEYVIRHNGAPQLKNQVAQDLYMFQYFLLDVAAVLILVVLLGIVLIICVFKIACKLLLSGRGKAKAKSS